MRTKPVCALQKVHKQFSRIYWSTICPIKMNLFVLIISANSDHIAFVADNVEELKLLEQATQKFISVPFLTTNFDGDGDVLAVIEPKT